MLHPDVLIPISLIAGLLLLVLILWLVLSAGSLSRRKNKCASQTSSMCWRTRWHGSRGHCSMGRQRRGLWRTGNELRTRDRPARTIHGSRRIGDGRLHRQRPGRRIAVASKFPLKASFSDRYGRTGARRTGAGRASLAPASWDRNLVAAAFTAAEAKLRWPPSLMAASEEHCPYCGRYGKAVLLDLSSPLWGRGSRQP